MKRSSGTLLALAALLLAGCGALRGPDAGSEPWVRADGPRPAGATESLLMYFEHVRKLPPAELAREHDAVRRLYAKEARADFTRLRYAMLLSVPGAPFSDDTRALEALDPLLRNQDAALHAVAFVVNAQIQEQRRAQALQQRIAEEQRRGQGLQNKVDEEQRRGQGLHQKFEEEQRRGQGLQQKLDALKSLEKSLIERDQGAPARRR